MEEVFGRRGCLSKEKIFFSSVPYHFLPINGELEFSFREQWKRYSNVRMEEKYNDRITRDKRRVVIVLIGRGEENNENKNMDN